MSDQSPFDVLEASLRLLCAGPSPLAVHGREVGPPFPRRLYEGQPSCSSLTIRVLVTVTARRAVRAGGWSTWLVCRQRRLPHQTSIGQALLRNAGGLSLPGRPSYSDRGESPEKDTQEEHNHTEHRHGDQ